MSVMRSLHISLPGTFSRHSLYTTPLLVPSLRRWMSVRPQAEKEEVASSPRKKTIQQLLNARSQDKPITVLTAYDYPSAVRCERHEIDICLVGDSLAQVALGYDSTTRLTLSEMIHHCKAVARGAKSPLLVADIPFGTAMTTDQALRTAVSIIQEGGVDAVKLEGGEEVADTIKALTTMGIPVMAHIGLLPQRHTSLSGYRVQGREASAALKLIRTAESLQNAGAFSIVLEAIPYLLATNITGRLSIPTIGIGAGPGCAGQVLVQDDALGVWNGHKAKFVRRFAEVNKVADDGIREYVAAVRDRSFPSKEESYDMTEEQWKQVLESLDTPDTKSA